MKQRVFIALDLPERIKSEISLLEEKWKKLPLNPVRKEMGLCSSPPLAPLEIKDFLTGLGTGLSNGVKWVKTENLHLTLAFLGYLEEKEIEKTKEILKEISQSHSSFLLGLDRMTLGPDFRKPRMIWLKGETPIELKKLVEGLNYRLKKEGILADESHPFSLHLTLARARGRELYNRKIEEKLNLTFPAKEVAIIESFLTPEGPIYKVLEKFSLKE